MILYSTWRNQTLSNDNVVVCCAFQNQTYFKGNIRNAIRNKMIHLRQIYVIFEKKN